MILSNYTDYLAHPLALWVTTASPDLVPEIARAGGIIPRPDLDEITIIVPEKFCKKTLSNLEGNKAISLLAANIITYVCYQFKGSFISVRPASAEEDALQQQYLSDFTDILAGMGYDKDSYYWAYNHQPSWAFDIKIEEVYEQTPKSGTGNRINTSAL